MGTGLMLGGQLQREIVMVGHPLLVVVHLQACPCQRGRFLLDWKSNWMMEAIRQVQALGLEEEYLLLRRAIKRAFLVVRLVLNLVGCAKNEKN
jgi:hypothetical protein